MTLGWVYQYWNDPEREALDAKLNGGGKVEPHEIASKTQMFTERYMVDWLLQNSLGPMWLAMCRKHGWTPEVEAIGEDGASTLSRMEARRIAWRGQRDARKTAIEAEPDAAEDTLPGVSATALMPLHSDAERRWAYYVPQPIPDDAVAHASASVRDLKIIDPAVGSGHFLVVAFELLVALYREEARHRGEEGQPPWTDRAIVERILEHNLHGIDLDPRAVQIAAAALWLKARSVCADARPRQLNLVASNLRLSSLPDDDPALLELRREVERETGIPAALTDQIIGALRGADHLGSLLKVDSTVDAAIEEMAGRLGKAVAVQGDLVEGFPAEQMRLSMSTDAAKAVLLNRLEGFLAKRTSGDDLGLRLRGEQLARGVRFVRLVRDGSYDIVVGNPPYLGATKLRSPAAYQADNTTGRADDFAAFFVRGLSLVSRSGTCAFVTLSNWMFLKAYADFRSHVLENSLAVLADFGKAAFSTGGTLISTSATILSRRPPDGHSVALRTWADYTPRRDEHQPTRTRASLLCNVGRHEFDPAALKVVPEWPLVYWWGREFLERYARAEKLGDCYESRKGTWTSDNARFLRRPHEVVSVKVEGVPPSNEVSFAFGVALGRFDRNGEGTRDPAKHDLSRALPAGICFLDGTLPTDATDDSLGHPAATPIHEAWKTHGPAIDPKRDVRTWLRLKFFGDVHRTMYENRPIHWPLCSEKKTFVAWVNIHRFTEQTLRILLADHLHPALTRIEGELTDLREARDGADRKAARAAEKRFDKVLKAKNELFEFIDGVGQCADIGPPPTSPDAKKCPTRETGARYAPDLDDGVMINSAALWPLLQPMWKDPKKWWTELSLAKGRKDYDWSHLAMRYWPKRVDEKCQTDPSLGVAHGCFWAYHPARAWAWELRLQDEIGPDFRIEEASYRGTGDDVAHRAVYLRDHTIEALAAVEKEALRRRGRGIDAKTIAEMTLLEPGLWSAEPEACWALEERIITKQEAPFHLRAPDEPEARAAFEAEHPAAVASRRELLEAQPDLPEPNTDAARP